MNSYGNAPQNPERNRRVERFAGEFLCEPSMSAPQPMPGRHGRKQAEPRQVGGVPNIPQVNPSAMQPEPVAPVQQPWAPAYPVQHDMGTMAPQQWSQSYPVQPGMGEAAPQQWSQSYPVQPGMGETAPQQWPQSYPNQGVPQWSQPFPAQPTTGEFRQTWSQPGTSPAWQGTNGYVPPQSMPEPEASRKGGGGGRQVWKLCLLALLVLALIVGAVIAIMQLTQHNALVKEVSAYNNRFCEGVYVDDIHLGGMTQDEAFTKVNANAQDRLASWGISLTLGGQLVHRFTAADLGMTVDVNDALAEAWEQGHAATGDVKARKASMDALLTEPYYGYTAQPSGDTSAVNRILNELAAGAYRAPQDATAVFLPDYRSYPFEFTPEVYGRYLDVEPIKAQISAMVQGMDSGSIELVPTTIAPKVTEAQLRQQRTLRGKATTEISTVSTPERTANIERAFQLINGYVMKPGQSFSFNGVVGQRSEKNGFHKAIEYAYGNEREGYGGGVCQASTTVYLAAVRADMTITHREPHSDKVNYTEYGLDATVNLDGKKIDLTFKNNSASDAYVMTYLVRSGGHWICHVDIYGEALPEGVTYDLVAETVEVLPAPVDPEYIEDKKGEHVLYIDEDPVLKRKASDGYVVDTFKVKYVNGKEVDREYVARDTYKAKSQQFYVGVKDRPLVP